MIAALPLLLCSCYALPRCEYSNLLTWAAKKICAVYALLTCAVWNWHERLGNVSRSAGLSGDGVSILRGAQLVTAHRPYSCAGPQYEWHEATSDASDSKGGGGGWVATCDGSADHLVSWCTQWLQCCPCEPAHAYLVNTLWDGSRQGALLTTLGSWCASAVRGLSIPPTLHAHHTWPPAGGTGIRVNHSMPGDLF